MSEEEATTNAAVDFSNPVVIGTVVVGLLLAVFLLNSSGKGSSESQSRGVGFTEEDLVKESQASSGASKNKKKKANKKKKPAAAAAAPAEPVEEPKAAEPEPVPEPVEEAAPQQNGAGKKKKKKKKGGANKVAPVETPAPAPSPAPAPAPPPVVEAPAPAPAPAEPEPAEGGKKKKKKKKKAKNAAAATTESAAPEQSAPAPAPAPTYYETPKVVEQWAPVKKKGKAVAPTTQQLVAAEPAPVESADSSADAVKTVQMSIGSERYSLVIGPQGSTIKNLELTTGCKFDVSKDGMVKITGTADQCAMATASIQSLLDEESARQARQVTRELQFDVASGAVKAVIGKGGAVIQDIEKRTGCKVDVNIDLGTCVIKGEQPNVDQAAQLCQNAVFGESQHVIELKKRGQINVIYGKNFETIRKLQIDSGAKLDLDRSTNLLKLSGTMEQVAAAKTAIMSLLDHNKGVEFQVKAKLVGAIYGKAGSTIRSIQERTNTYIEVNDAAIAGGDATCCIMGEPKDVTEARRLVQMALDGETELKPGEVLHTVDLGPGAPAVIGKGGSKVAELEKRHGVKIKVNSGTAQCRIVGQAKQAAEAKAEVESIIQPMLAELEIAKLAEQEAQNGNPAWSGGADDDLDGW